MRIQNIKQIYSGRTVLDIPEFEFEQGLIYAIIGSNGSGKSTLSRILCAIDKPAEGVRICGPDERCGYRPQKSYAFYGSVFSNVKLGLQHNAHDTERVDQAIRAVKLEELRDARAKSLSGGETSRMALARILVGDYSLIAFDEPTASLDVASTILAEELIRTYRDQHYACVVVVTHSMNQARRLSDKVIFLKDGQIVETGNTAEVLDHPQTPELAEFIDIIG